jgi:hypothetical protein
VCSGGSKRSLRQATEQHHTNTHSWPKVIAAARASQLTSERHSGMQHSLTSITHPAACPPAKPPAPLPPLPRGQPTPAVPAAAWRLPVQPETHRRHAARPCSCSCCASLPPPCCRPLVATHGCGCGCLPVAAAHLAPCCGSCCRRAAACLAHRGFDCGCGCAAAPSRPPLSFGPPPCHPCPSLPLQPPPTLLARWAAALLSATCCQLALSWHRPEQR